MALVLHPTLATDEPRDESTLKSRGDSSAVNSSGGYSGGGGKGVPYRGLSNQGATCYLNSLLQSLYMTPEFRTAIFAWQYNEEKDGVKDECIPYQLQSLFGQMQLSKAGALSTKALTESFGWGNAEAFQQQDVQELCRVLFDRLEEAFKGTPNQTLVNDLYQGEMVDYLETIGYPYVSNKASEFLDMSLQIKAFGSDVAFSSVDESLRSYLAPERLEKENQILVEEAKAKLAEGEPESNAKFDAIKGFRLEKIPYVLTLQLKRFDLNYETFQRIKLNDQVRFPRVLDMNEFVFQQEKESSKTSVDGEGGGVAGAGQACVETAVQDGNGARDNNVDLKGEQSSGDASDGDISSPRLSPVELSSPAVGGVRSDFELSMSLERERLMHQTETEGAAAEEDAMPSLPDLVDVSGFKAPDQTREEAEAARAAREQKFPEDEDCDPAELVRTKGEWVYELYAVLIHSGSALGGHYYAYIKNMSTQKWYNFNDSSVTEVDSFERTVRGAWGGAKNNYNSGANAYMLMYRKFDPVTNKGEPGLEAVPAYIRDEVMAAEAEILRKEEIRAERARELDMKVSLLDPSKPPQQALVVSGVNTEITVPFDKARSLRAFKQEAARALGILLEVDEKKKAAEAIERKAEQKILEAKAMVDATTEAEAAVRAGGGAAMLSEEVARLFAAKLRDLQGEAEARALDDGDNNFFSDMPALEGEDDDLLPPLDVAASAATLMSSGGTDQELAPAVAVVNAWYEGSGVPDESLRLREVHSSRKVMGKPFERAQELETLADLTFYSYKKVGLEVRSPQGEFAEYMSESIFLNIIKFNPAMVPNEPPAMRLPWRPNLDDDADSNGAEESEAAVLGGFEEAVPVFVSKNWTLGRVRQEVAARMGIEDSGKCALFNLATGMGAKTVFLHDDDKILHSYDSMKLHCEEMPCLPTDSNYASHCLSQRYQTNAEQRLKLHFSTLDDTDSTEAIVADYRWKITDLRRAIALSLGISAVPQVAEDSTVCEESTPEVLNENASTAEREDAGKASVPGLASDAVMEDEGVKSIAAAFLTEAKERALLERREPVYEFRLMMGTGTKEVRSSSKTLKEESFYRDVKLYVKSGRSAEVGEYYFKFFLFQQGRGTSKPGIRKADLAPPPPLPAVADTVANPGESTDAATLPLPPTILTEKGGENKRDEVEGVDGSLESPVAQDSSSDDEDGMPTLLSDEEETTEGDNVEPMSTPESEEEVTEWSNFALETVSENPSLGDFDSVPMSVLVSEAMPVCEVRRQVFQQCVARGLLSKHDDIGRVRVREKEGPRARKILRDTTSDGLPRTVKQTGVQVYDGRELACEILEEPEDLVAMEKMQHAQADSGVGVEAAVSSSLTSSSGPGLVVWVCRWQRSSFTLTPAFEFFARTSETLGELAGRLARAVGISDARNLRVLRVPMYGPIPKLHELPGTPVARIATQPGWHDLRGESLGEPHRAKRLMRDGPLSLQELSSDLLVLQDVTEPLRELTVAEKGSIEKTNTSSLYSSSTFNVNRGMSTGTYPPKTPGASKPYVKPKETGVLIKKRGGIQQKSETGVVINGGSSGGVEGAALMDDDEPPILDTCEFGSELDALD